MRACDAFIMARTIPRVARSPMGRGSSLSRPVITDRKSMAESAKSNCLMRCCKDLGIASELWDPTFVKRWVATYATEAWCVNVGSRDRGKKKKLWR